MSAALWRILALALLLPPLPGQADAVAAELPVLIADLEWRPLLEREDVRLHTLLERRLSRNPDWRKLIESRKLAVGLVDLSEPNRPRYAELNGRVEMYAASLPKIAILLATFDQFERGLLARTPEIEQDLAAMIRVSDNRAATRMIDRLGGLEAVNKTLSDPVYRFYDANGSGGLWVGKRYAKRGPRLPDPVKGISHAATVNQACRFYYQLATGRLISRQASREMLAMLADPGIEHKFVKTLRQRSPRARLYRKSGTWRHWHADSVLVWGPEWRRYILVAMVESPKGEQILRDLVAVIEGVLQADAGPFD